MKKVIGKENEVIAEKAKDFFNLPEEGEYEAKIIEVKKHPTKNDKALVTFKLDNGADYTQEFELSGYKAYTRTAMLIKAMEGDYKKRVNLKEYIGEEVVLEIVHKKTEDGRNFANIKSIAPLASDSDDEETGDDSDDDSDEIDDNEESEYEEDYHYEKPKPGKGMKGPKKRRVDEDDDDE